MPRKRSLSLAIAVLGLAALPLLGGCQSSIPEAIRTAPAGDLQLGEVRHDAAHHIGEQVRWGGVIQSVENLADETRIVVVARKLHGDGEPRDEETSPGRFIARFTTFVDPAIFTPSRHLTVSGTITGLEESRIGAYPYTYPVVTVESHQLWRVAPPPCYDCDPLLYDPWWPYSRPYYPGYPYYPRY